MKDRQGMAITLGSMGRAQLGLGHWEQAKDCFHESLQLNRDVGDKFSIADSLEGLAAIDGRTAVNAATPDRLVRHAVRLCAAAESLRRQVGSPRPPVDREEFDRTVVLLHQQLHEEDFDAEWTIGQVLTLHQIVGEALEESHGD